MFAPGMMTDLAFARRHHARAIGPISRISTAQVGLTFTMSAPGSIGDFRCERDFSLDRSQIEYAAPARPDMMTLASQQVFSSAARSVEHGRFRLALNAVCPRGAADHIGAVGELLGRKVPLLDR